MTGIGSDNEQALAKYRHLQPHIEANYNKPINQWTGRKPFGMGANVMSEVATESTPCTIHAIIMFKWNDLSKRKPMR